MTSAYDNTAPILNLLSRLTSVKFSPGVPSAEPLRQLQHVHREAAPVPSPRLAVQRQTDPASRDQDRNRLPARPRQLRREGGERQRHLRIRELVKTVDRLAVQVELPAGHRLEHLL